MAWEGPLLRTEGVGDTGPYLWFRVRLALKDSSRPALMHRLSPHFLMTLLTNTEGCALGCGADRDTEARATCLPCQAKTAPFARVAWDWWQTFYSQWRLSQTDALYALPAGAPRDLFLLQTVETRPLRFDLPRSLERLFRGWASLKAFSHTQATAGTRPRSQIQFQRAVFRVSCVTLISRLS